MRRTIGAEPALNLFDADRHIYTSNGRWFPSVTQVLSEERFINFAGIPESTLAEARARGTYVHQVLHLYLEDDFDIDDCDPRFRGYLDSAIAYLAEAKIKPLRDSDGKPMAVEYRFWHQPRMFAGTVDYVGWDPDGVLALTDFKSGNPTDVAADLQTAAYECGIRDCLLPTLTEPYTGPIRRRAVRLFRDGAPGKPEPYNDPHDLAIFFAALTCVHYRRNAHKHMEGFANGY